MSEAENRLAAAIVPVPTQRAVEQVTKQVAERVDVAQGALDSIRLALDARDEAERAAQVREVELLKARLRGGDDALMKSLDALTEALKRPQPDVHVHLAPTEVSVTPPDIHIAAPAVTVPITVEATHIVDSG